MCHVKALVFSPKLRERGRRRGERERERRERRIRKE
jgi:hypothetical protein